MKQLFNQDSFLMVGFSKLTDYLIVSMCWLVCSLPIITLGSATIAMYDTIAHCIKNDEAGIFRRYFRTFKNELLRGSLLTLLWGAIGVSLFIVTRYFKFVYDGGGISHAVYLISYGIICIPIAILCWVIALESRYSLGFLQLHRNALLLTIGRLPSTVALLILLAVGIAAFLYMPITIIFVPGFVGHIQSIFIERTFKKVWPEETEPEEAEAVEALPPVE